MSKCSKRPLSNNGVSSLKEFNQHREWKNALLIKKRVMQAKKINSQTVLCKSQPMPQCDLPLIDLKII